MTVDEIYNQTIRPLPTPDRLKLASLILNDIPPQSMVDYSEEWKPEDYEDFRRAGWAHIESALQDMNDGCISQSHFGHTSR
jgi:hypothetical protein